MTQETWTAVDKYFCDGLVPSDADLEATLQASDDAGLPKINVAPNQGKMLMLLARIHGAKSILEVGTLGGYSTLWLAGALPTDGTGRLITLEFDPKHAEVAQANFERAGLDQTIELRLGPALETLPQLAADHVGPFDVIFIDADKNNYPGYFDWALKLSRPGTLIILDNVVRGGAVIDKNTEDLNVQGVRLVTERIASEPHVTATAIQTVGSKGYDGFMLVLVTGR